MKEQLGKLLLFGLCNRLNECNYRGIGTGGEVLEGVVCMPWCSGCFLQGYCKVLSL